MNWQPIKTAPKDGAVIWLKCSDHPEYGHVLMWWCADHRRWECYIFGVLGTYLGWWSDEFSPPTHWARVTK
jgi:hypothetical protein